MKKVYSSPDILSVRSAEALLKSYGIDTLVLGEDRLSSSGAIAPIDCWLELLILDDTKEEDALRYIDAAALSTHNTRDTWICETCREVLDAQFTECWNCSGRSTEENIRLVSPDVAQQRFWLRALIVLDVVLSVASFKIGSRVDDSIGSSFREAFAHASSNPVWDCAWILYGWYVLKVFSWIGLFLLYNWGRALYLALLGFYLITLTLYQSGIVPTDGMLSLVSTSNFIVVGALVAMTYLPSLSKSFRDR